MFSNSTTDNYIKNSPCSVCIGAGEKQNSNSQTSFKPESGKKSIKKINPGKLCFIERVENFRSLKHFHFGFDIIKMHNSY